MGYDYQKIRRDAAEVADTETNRFLVSLSTRPSRSLQARVRYRLEQITGPFTHLRAAYSPALQPNPSPGSPPSPLLGTQYYTLYAARQANLTMFPSLIQLVEPSITWAAGERSSFSIHYRWRTERNDKLNFSDWERQAHLPGVEAWFAPTQKLNLTLAYNFHNERSHTLFVVPAFDG